MLHRQSAKEKSKTLLRTRTLFDYLGFGVLLIAYFPLLILPIVGWFAAIFFRVGMIRASLRMNRGDRNVRVADVALAGDRLGRGVTISLWRILFLLLWNLPGLALVGIGALVGAKSFVDSLFGSRSPVGVAVMVPCFIIGVVWMIFITLYKVFQYQFAEYVSEDKRNLSGLERNLSGLDCIRESTSLTKGHIWELFVLSLSFLGWKILASVFPINIWYTPYADLTYASVYEQLRGSFKAVPKNEMEWYANGGSIRVVPKEPGDGDGKPVPEKHALEVISGEYVGTSFPIADGDEIRIGRDPKRANVVISMGVTAISGLHCSIRYSSANNSYLITDFSANGTYLDNQRLQKEVSVSAAPSSIVKLADGSMMIRLA